MYASRLLLRTTSTGILARSNKWFLRFNASLAPSTRLDGLVEQMKAASSAHVIHALYPQFVEALADAKDRPPQFGSNDVKALLHTLVSSHRSEDWQRIKTILKDLLPRLGIPPTLDMYKIILESHARRSQLVPFRSLTKYLSRLPENFELSTDTLNDYLEMFTFHTIPDLVVAFLHYFGRWFSLQPNDRTIAIYLHHAADICRSAAGHIPEEHFNSLVKFIELPRVPWNDGTSRLLNDLFADIGDIGLVRKLERRCRTYETTHAAAANWLRQLDEARKSGGVAAALELFLSMKLDPTREILSLAGQHILADTCSLADLHLLDKELGPKASARRWEKVIRNNVKLGKLDDAIEIYSSFRKEGIPLEAGVVSPILWGLLIHNKGKSDDGIQTAFAIYRDLVPSAKPQHKIRRSTHPDPGIYFSLFRLLDRSRRIERYTEEMESLIEDMETYKIEIEGPLAGLVVRVGIRLASSFDEAVELYHNLKHKIPPNHLVNVLENLVKRRPPLSARWVQEFITIVKAIRHSGNFSHVKTAFTTVLVHIGSLATSLKHLNLLDSCTCEALLHETREIHNYLSHDSATPSIAVFSQLVGTYARLGSIEEAQRVWQSLYTSGRYTPRTVSNILDSCGWCGDLAAAKSIWAQLSESHFELDVKCWETYIECLGRLNQVEHATNVLLVDMAHTGFDRGTAAWVLKTMAIKHKVLEQYLDTLRSADPILYNRVVFGRSPFA